MRKQWKQWETSFSWAPTSLQMVTSVVKLKDTCSLEEKLWQTCCVLAAQLCLILCNPLDCSLPESSVHVILQAKSLEWVAISFSMRSAQPRDWTHVSCIGRQILYHWATREALEMLYWGFYGFSVVKLDSKTIISQFNNIQYEIMVHQGHNVYNGFCQHSIMSL